MNEKFLTFPVSLSGWLIPTRCARRPR